MNVESLLYLLFKTGLGLVALSFFVGIFEYNRLAYKIALLGLVLLLLFFIVGGMLCKKIK